MTEAEKALEALEKLTNPHIFLVQMQKDELAETIRKALRGVDAHPQHDVQGLLEALQTLACLGNGEQWGNSTGNLIAQKALKSYQEGRG